MSQPYNKKLKLPETHPYLKDEWADEEPFEKYSKGSKFKARWLCPKGHHYHMMIQNKIKGQECGVCAGYQIIKGVNDLGSTHPHLIKEWHPDNEKTPFDFTSGSSKNNKWICQKNPHHVWSTSISHRTGNKPTGCPYCAGKKVLPGDNDLAKTHPELIKEWHSMNKITPTEIVAGTQKSVKWECSQCLHTYNARISDRTYKKQGCPVCSGQKVITGVNDLATTHPLIAKDLNDEDFKATEITSTSGRKLQWKCPLGHEYKKIVANRTKQGQGCPHCSGRKVLQGYNDLATTHPELKTYWKDKTREITTVSSGSGFIAEWKCHKGHTFKRAIYNMVSSPECPVCSGKLIVSGINDLQTLYPKLAKEWSKSNTIKPNQISPGSYKNFEWECKKGHLWNATPTNRTRFGHGCPKCWASTYVSKNEQEIYDYIVTILPDNTLVEQSNRALIGKELDIYIPSLNFSIEYNGNYWHSEKMGKDQWYHYNKWKECKKKGVQLFTVWEDDYLRNPELIKNMISYKLGLNHEQKISARKTVFKQVSNKEAHPFYEKHHLQRNHKSSKHYALTINDNEIVAMMSIRYSEKKQELEISRFATGKTVQGGFSKLLKNILKLNAYNTCQKVVSYSHNDHSWGELYKQNGFQLITEGTPNYFYFKAGDKTIERKHRLNYSPKRFKERKELIYEEGKTEIELAEMNDLIRIWDCGSSRWEKAI